jgi:hypothetical protein
MARKIENLKWLTISKRGLGCTICKSVGTLEPAKTQGSKLSSEWCQGRVREYGETKEKNNSRLGINFLVINYRKLMLKLVTFYALLKKKQLKVRMLKHKKKIRYNLSYI